MMGGIAHASTVHPRGFRYASNVHLITRDYKAPLAPGTSVIGFLVMRRNTGFFIACLQPLSYLSGKTCAVGDEYPFIEKGRGMREMGILILIMDRDLLDVSRLSIGFVEMFGNLMRPCRFQGWFVISVCNIV
jgi:hypothetical protein